MIKFVLLLILTKTCMVCASVGDTI